MINIHFTAVVPHAYDFKATVKREFKHRYVISLTRKPNKFELVSKIIDHRLHHGKRFTLPSKVGKGSPKKNGANFGGTGTHRIVMKWGVFAINHHERKIKSLPEGVAFKNRTKSIFVKRLPLLKGEMLNLQIFQEGPLLLVQMRQWRWLD